MSSWHSWKILIGRDDLRKGVSELGKKIGYEYRGDRVTVVCILNGGATFTNDLIRAFSHDTKDIEVIPGYIMAKSYQRQMQSEIIIGEDFLNKSVISDRDVLVVDDIFDSGQTLNVVTQLLNNVHPKPKSVKSAVILSKRDRHLRHKFPITPNYICFPEIAGKDEWVVGYGLDVNDRYRNLPDIRVYPREYL